MSYEYKKSKTMKNFYLVPNQLMQIKLKPTEVAIYNYLLYCEDRSTYQCYPSYKSIASALDITKNTLRKYVKTLEEKCLIYTEYTTVTLKNGKKQNGNLKYTIRPIQDAVKYYHSKQLEYLDENNKKLEADKLFQKYSDEAS